MSKRVLQLPDIQEIEANFLHAYLAAGAPLDDFWYNDVYFLCLEMALEYRIRYDVIAAVIATLSPLTPWSTNVKNARKMIEFALANRSRLLDFFTGKIKNVHIDVLNDITELFAHVQGYNANKAKALSKASCTPNLMFLNFLPGFLHKSKSRKAEPAPIKK